MSSVRCSHRDGVTTLALQAPPNPLTAETVAALRSGVADAVSMGSAVLLFEAEGRSFCAGFDLAPIRAGEDDASAARRFVDIGHLLEDIRHAPLLSIAACDGAAVGAGADLVAACSIRIASADARFRFPGAALGICLGTGRLAELVGSDRALRWVIEGRWIDALEAQGAGLVSELVDAPGPAAEDLAARAAAMPEGTTRLLVQAVSPPEPKPAAIALLRRSTEQPGLADRVAALLGGRRWPGVP